MSPTVGPDPECYTYENGLDYRGSIDHTKDGALCIEWDLQWIDDDDLANYPHSSCRNPDGDSSPWCFTSNSDEGSNWGYCAIGPKSDECSNRVIGK